MAFPLLLLGAGLAAGALFPVVSTEAAKFSRQFSSPNAPQAASGEEARRFLSSRDFDVIAQAGQTQASRRVQELGALSQLQEAVPLSRLARPDITKEIFRGAQKEALARGYSQSESTKIANLVVDTERAREIGLGGSVVSAEVGANLIGRGIFSSIAPRVITREALEGGARTIAQGVPRSLQPSIIQQSIFRLPGVSRLQFLQSPLATASGRATGRAAVFEGSSAVLSERVARRQYGQSEEGTVSQLFGLEKGSVPARALSETEQVVAGGAFGAAVGKPLGFIIGGQAPVRKGVSKLYEVTGMLIDPAELPGDVATSGAERLRRAVSKKTGIPEFRIRVTSFNPGIVNNLTGETQGANATVQFVSDKASTQLDALSKSNVFAPTNIRDLGTIPTTPPGQTTNVPAKSPPTIVPGTNATVQAETEVPAETSVPANTLSDVFAEVPTRSTIYRGGTPPLPLFGPIGSGYRAGRGKGRTKFFNELSLLRGLIGQQFRPIGRRPMARPVRQRRPITYAQFLQFANKERRRTTRRRR